MRISINKLIVASLIISLYSNFSALAAPRIFSIQQVPDDLGEGRLTSIAVDALDRPHIAADGGPWLFLYDKVGSVWQNNSINLGTRGYTQFFNPQIEIDANNVAWCSGIVFGRNIGMAMVVRENITTTPANGFSGFAYHSVTPGSWGVGEVSLDPKQPGYAYLAGSSGYYGLFQYDPSARGKARRVGDIQRLYAGNGGEKNAFWVSKNEEGRQVKHMASNGYSREDSRYRNSNMGNPVDWAAYSRHPGMGNDGAYLDIKSDSLNPSIAYIASDFYSTGVYLNIWDGTRMLRPDTNLISIDPNGTSGLRRFAPQLYPAKYGGVYVTYTRNERVMLQYVTPKGDTPWGSPVEIGRGGRSSICVDSKGDIHLAYTEAGRTKYRKIIVSPMVLVAPAGRSDSKTPTFRWDPLAGVGDMTLYYWPKDNAAGNVSEIAVAGTSHSLESELAVGRWEWMLTGMYDGKLVESQVESFSIPPNPPQPVAPTARLNIGDDTPTFRWDDPEGSPWYHVEIRKYGPDGLSSEVVGRKWTQEREWAPSAGLGKGCFTWNIYAFDGRHAPGIHSDWSQGMDFQIGVPGEVEFTAPTSSLVYTNAKPVFAWRPAEREETVTASTWYQLYVIHNGRVINDVDQTGSGWFCENPEVMPDAVSLTNGNLHVYADIDPLKPGEYSIWVRPVDVIGSGPWSGAHQFIVNRRMNPGAEGGALGFGPTVDPADTRRPDFSWTEDEYAAWYNMVLVKDGDIVANVWSRTGDWKPDSDLENGNYRWWVRSYHFSNGYESPWLEAAAFQMGIPAKSKPLTPSGQTSNPPTFEWTEVDGADAYELWYQKADQENTRVSVSTTNTYHTPAQALDAGQYHWWIGCSNQYAENWNEEYMEFEIP